MVVTRERYLDDSKNLHVTLELTSRSVAMHGLLTSAPPEVVQRVGECLVKALDDVAGVLADCVARAARAAETSSFGCGT